MVAITFSIFPVALASNTITTDTENISVKLDTNTSAVLTTTPVVSIIVPGNSADDIAQQQAAAAAAAKAKALAVHKTASVARTYNDPSDFDLIYQRADAATGVDWKLLKAIHIVETGGSGSTGLRNASGATGPMQFLPSTFRHYAIDGNGDGITDIANVEDAIFTAANYLRACGYPSLKVALWGYNPSSYYFSKVMNTYRTI